MQTKYPHTVEELNANLWLEVTDEQFDDALGAVPPARHTGWCFALGEPSCDLDDGRVVHSMYVRVDGKCYTKPDALVNYNPALYLVQVRYQRKVKGA